MTTEALRDKSRVYRRKIVDFIYRNGAGHTGGSLSCVDILNVLYNEVMRVFPSRPADPGRDIYIQSKGHSVEALYVVLADLGFFDDSLLEGAYSFGSSLVGHPTRHTPGIEHNTGALGHGLSVAVGYAVAAMMDRTSRKVFCLMGDGELAEGSVWEAASAASHYGLDNLVAVVDRNGLQISGPTEEVMHLEPLAERWRSFGWAVHEGDGHDLEHLVSEFAAVPFETGKPSLYIARTVKGSGISFMENNPGWHHRVPSAEEYEAAIGELA